MDAERGVSLNVAGGARICIPLALDQITPYVLLEQEDWISYHCVAEALDANETPARRISLARLTWALRWRSIAADILLASAQRIEADAQQILAEPFLALSRRPQFLSGPARASLSERVRG